MKYYIIAGEASGDLHGANLIKAIYQEDIDAVNAFYDTKAGKNFINSQPLIMQESMIVGQAWSQAIVQKVIAKAQTEMPQAAVE